MSKKKKDYTGLPPIKDLHNEIWKLVENSDNPIEISNYGRVKSYFFNTKGTLLRGRPVQGFLKIDIRHNGRKSSALIHKLVANAFVPVIDPEKTMVHHIDWNKQNNKYTNLEWIKPFELHQLYDAHIISNPDSVAKDVKPICKLSDDIVIHIRKMLKSGMRQGLIAKVFDISEMQITRIKRNQNWITLTAEMNEDLPTIHNFIAQRI